MELQGFQLISRQRERSARSIIVISIAVFLTVYYNVEYGDLKFLEVEISKSLVEVSTITLLLFQLANLLVSLCSDYLGKRGWNSDKQSTDGSTLFDQAGDPRTLVNEFSARFRSNGVEIIRHWDKLAKDIEKADKIESLKDLKTSIDALSELLEKSMKGIDKVYCYNCFLSYIWYGILPILMSIGAVCTIVVNMN